MPLLHQEILPQVCMLGYHEFCCGRGPLLLQPTGHCGVYCRDKHCGVLVIAVHISAATDLKCM